MLEIKQDPRYEEEKKRAADREAQKQKEKEEEQKKEEEELNCMVPPGGKAPNPKGDNRAKMY